MMTYSEDGLTLTKSFEGCRLKAYQDQGGVWTIGYGHTQYVNAGQTCSQELADAWLQTDLMSSANGVAIMVKVPLTQGQFDALVDFCFNLGRDPLRTSTLLRKLNSGDYGGAAEEFLKWDKVRINGVLTPAKGLTRRRAAEKSLFEGKPWDK